MPATWATSFPRAPQFRSRRCPQARASRSRSSRTVRCARLPRPDFLEVVLRREPGLGDPEGRAAELRGAEVELDDARTIRALRLRGQADTGDTHGSLVDGGAVRRVLDDDRHRPIALLDQAALRGEAKDLQRR